MIYAEAIKTGFRLINRRWQLVAIQAAMMLLNCIGFFVMVGIPLGIAFVIFGLDLTGLASARDFFGILKNPTDLISKYLGLVMVVLTSFLFYLVLVTTAGLFVFGGSVGVISRALSDPSSRFDIHDFFREAKRHFFPLMWYSLLAGVIFILVAFILGLCGGGIAAVVSVAKGQDSTLALFLGIFFSLVLLLIGLFIIMGVLSVTVFGIAVLIFRNEKALKSFREAFAFVWNKQEAFWLFTVLFGVYIIVSFVVMVVAYPFNLIPVFGTIISFPLQIIQGYLWLVIFATIFAYYFEKEVKQPVTEAAEGPALDTTGQGSSSPDDTSLPEAQAQEKPRPETDQTPQD